MLYCAFGIYLGIIFSLYLKVPSQLRCDRAYVFIAIFRKNIGSTNACILFVTGLLCFILYLIDSAMGLPVRLGWTEVRVSPFSAPWISILTGLFMGAIPSRLLSLSEEYSATLANPLNLGKVGLLGARGYQWLLELGIQRAVRLAIREDADDCYVGRGYWSLSHGKNPKVGMRRFRILYAREKRSMFREYSARAILNQNPGNHRAQFATLTLYFGRSGLRDRLLSDRTLSRGSNNWQGKERRKDLRGKISFRRRKNRDLRDHENEALILDLIQESPGDSKESQISKKKRQGRRVIPGAQVIDSTPSVFVSYSHKDSEFVDRVIGYLQPRGIDCWRDVHDLVAGPMDAQIDEALGKQKAVLVVLSSSSVDSDWVEREAIAAREEEKRLSVSHGQARYRLCPVALDGAWKTCAWPAWLRNQIKKYNVLDLSKWKSQPDFQMQMDKLVDGLLKYYRK